MMLALGLTIIACAVGLVVALELLLRRHPVPTSDHQETTLP